MLRILLSLNSARAKRSVQYMYMVLFLWRFPEMCFNTHALSLNQWCLQEKPGLYNAWKPPQSRRWSCDLGEKRNLHRTYIAFSVHPMITTCRLESVRN